MPHCLRLVPLRRSLCAIGLMVGTGCGNRGVMSAIDCYAELPDNVKDRPSKRYRATPTRPGPLVESTSVTEQLQVANVRRPDDTETLYEDLSESWVGIAYDPAHANPSNPEQDWNTDYVFEVSFSDRVPGGFSSASEHFEEDSPAMVWATVDQGNMELSLSALEMVIADSGCDRL
ncbi:MAG TPA: hypothetical protein DFR83_28095, partial [Deltaproteobacteria bacterium]|nr:hypothetical protein [Deltaproteobacteria bacterium]